MDSNNALDEELTANLDTAELDDSRESAAAAPAAATTSPPSSAPAAARASSSAEQTAVTSSDVLLRGRYILEAKIGEGGTSVVYRARDVRRDAAAPGGQRVALKLLRPGLRNHPRAVERLKREFHHAQTLSHPHIARVYDVDCESGAWFLTLELLEGETLGALLDRQIEPLPSRRALDILRACGEALAFAHERGVIHGDFKPGNVFVTSSGQLRVLDFGSASASWFATEAQHGTATPAYASPEVLAGQRGERRDDVFSFACVAYELFTGEHPFGRAATRNADTSERLPDPAWNLSGRQWFALRSGLALSRQDRPNSVRALLAELATELPQPLRLPELSESKGPFRASRLAPIGAIAALCALAAVLFVANWVLVDQPQAGLDASSSRPDATTDATDGNAATLPAPQVAAPAPQPAVVPAVQREIGPNRSQEAVATPPTSPKPVRTSAVVGAPPAIPAVTPRGLPPLVSFDVESVTVNEGAVAAVLRINRRQQLDGRVQVRWRTLTGSARGGHDYRTVDEGTADFADGQSTRAIYVPLLNDLLAERDETFAVELFTPGGSTRINPIGRARITVRDDDLPRG